MSDEALRQWALRVAGSILRREAAALAQAAQGGNSAAMERNSVELASAMAAALMDAFKQGQRMPSKARGRISL